MRTRSAAGGGFPLLVCLALATLGPPSECAAATLRWSRSLRACETPLVFYSSRHQPGRPPCCPSVEGICPGGDACPPDGVCPGGTACVPAAITPRPNIVVLLADDQGACHYGTAGECRSVETGTPIPPPSTPNLDLLAGYGTVFPIAHNTASWCFPSIASILTGRYARNYGGGSRIADRLTTIPKALRSLDGAGAPPDPWNAGNVVGGYCTFLGGKFTPSIGDHGFDALAKGRHLGRTRCRADAQGGPPNCASDMGGAYQPTTVFRLEELFTFLEGLKIRLPGTGSGNAADFAMQHFFAWVAPRIPHQPLRSPSEIETYLFGRISPPALGGLFQLGQYCSPGFCAPVVTALNESNFGTTRAYYANLWWLDDLVRELRKYLARVSAPHCIDPAGQGRYDITRPEDCRGVWASTVTPDPARNTVFIYLSDNGWFLPRSKHAFTENGYRTRIIVFDPRNLAELPGWNGVEDAAPPPPYESFQLAHSTDVLATTLGYALDAPGAQACPVASDGTRCDGRDLRPWVAQSGLPLATEPLRLALCGHQTKQSTAPTRFRYLLTRPGSVGRCIDLTAPACTADAECGAAATCLGGHCTPSAQPPCIADAQCPQGAACLGGRCRSAPSCIDDAACAQLFPGGQYACLEQETRWCRNAPGVRCSTHADCPACPPGPGATAAPCGRVCEPRQLKLYVAPAGSTAKVQLTDLFLDPDEDGLGTGKEGTLVDELSRPNGRYASTIQRLNCCVDDWWPDAAADGTRCAGGCPADFSCTK
jgi:hypothetical protein